MFILRPVTITDPYTHHIMSVWATTQGFFDYFNLDIQDMSLPWPRGAKWTLPVAPETRDGYFLLRKGPMWAEFFGEPEQMVQSDDRMFLDEILLGLPIELDLEVSQKGELGEQDVLEVIIHPTQIQ